MSPHRILSFAVVICAFSSLCSCGGSSSQPPPTVNPTPAIQAISPMSAAAGTNGFTLAITGSNFLSSSVVAWNGSTKQATLVSSSQLAVAISTGDLGTSGTAQITVSNPAPGGGQASTSFMISAPAAPGVTSVSPSALTVGDGPVSLTVSGNNFVMSSVAEWNGSSRPTTYVSNTQLTVAIPASDVASPSASVPITVSTPSPGGGTSNSIPVVVQNPLPSISSLSPSRAVLGGVAFTLTANGSNFVSGATVYWNSVSRVTLFVSSTQLTASILASDLALPSGNSASITVQNPSPSAGVSNATSLGLENPAPQINSISRTSSLAGVSVSITVAGSGFVPGATIQLESQTFPTNFVTLSSLSSQVTASVGSLTLTVTNPSPAAGPSNGIPYTGIAAGPGANLVPVSVDASGNILNGRGARGTISSTGRYYAFNEDVSAGFLRDTCLGVMTGCVATTIQYPMANNPLPCSPAALSTEGVSMDGRYVAYSWDCVTVISNGADLELSDTCLGVSAGCNPKANQLVPSAVPSSGFMLPNAAYIAYGAGNSFGNFTGGLYSTCIGAPPGCSQTSISVTDAFAISVPVPSSDGRYVVYGENQFPNAQTSYKVNLHDSCLGAAPGCAPFDTAVSATGCHSPSISSDAQYIVYICDYNPVTVGTFLQATCLQAASGCSTVPSPVTQPYPSFNQSTPLVSTGGRFVAFAGGGATIMGQLMNTSMVFVYDSCNGAAAGCVKQTVPVSLSSDGAVPNGDCTLAGMSTDGQYLLFSSSASNLTTPSADAYIARNPLF